MTKLTLASCVLVLVAALARLAAVAPAEGSRPLTVDAGRSEVVIEVGKSGAFSFAAGHSNEVIGPIAGKIALDAANPERSRVELEIDTPKLKVTGKGDPPNDVPKVQQVMLSDQVLDVRRYPTIRFVSTSVSIKNRNETTIDAIVAGKLTLHGVTHEIAVPVTARSGPTLTAKGRFSVKQTEYEIKPVSVGGVVSVKDALGISFSIVAR